VLKILFAVEQISESVMTKGLLVTTAVVYVRVDKASSRTLHVNKWCMAKYRPTFMTTVSRRNVKNTLLTDQLTPVLSVLFF